MKNIAKNGVGVDVSKDWLDIYIDPANHSFRVDNDDAGIALLLEELEVYDISQVVCESSGGYEYLMMKMLRRSNYRIWQVEPNRIKSFIRSEGMKAKTDAIDARMIAKFAVEKKPSYNKIVNEENEKIRGLVKRRKDLVNMMGMEKRRALHPQCFYKKDIQRHMNFLKKECKKVEKKIKEFISKDTDLKKKCRILESMPGIGANIAAILVVDMPELGTLENKQAAALLGVAPYTRESGKFRGAARIGGGRKRPRHNLYIAALVAARRNKYFKSYYERLRSAGKKTKVALVAVMNKLICTLNAMLMRGELWIEPGA